MQIFDYSKSLVENLNFLSGPIIAIFGLAAIIQIRLAKKAIVVSSKRQAAELATKQIDKYAEQIIPMLNSLSENERKINHKRITFPEIKDFTLPEFEKKITPEIFTLHFEYGITNLPQINPILNSLETLATYFIKGVADEEIAFSSIGSSFCYNVESFAFDICLARPEDVPDTYNNLVELYHIWNPRLKSKKLSRELEKKKEELTKLKLSKIDILGSK